MGAERLKVTSHQKKTVGALISGAVLLVLTQTAISPAFPAIMAEMGVDAATVQWLTSAYALTEAVVIPTAAWFMGRFDMRKLYAALVALFGVGSVVSAVAPGFPLVLAGRVVQAACAGIMMVVVMAVILLAFPKEHRGKVMGVVSLSIGFAPAIGPVIGGLVVDAAGWRALFWAVAICSALIAAVGLALLEPSESFPSGRFDFPSIVCSSIGLVSLLYGLSALAHDTPASVCAALIVVGAVFIVFFARRQFSLEEPLLRLDALKSRRYRWAIVVVVFMQAILIGLVVLMPVYVQNVLGYSATVSGLVVLPGAFLGALFAIVAGRVLDRDGIRRLALVGSTLMVASCVGMFLYGPESPLIYVIAANCLNGICIQLLITPLITWGINSLGNELVQHATAVTNTMNQVGGAIGTAVIMTLNGIGMAASSQVDAALRAFDGCHLSFGAALGFSLAGLVVVTLCIRDKVGDSVLQGEC